MTDLAIKPNGAWRVAGLAAWLAVALGAGALILLGLAPLGWRAGLWHYRVSLRTLMPDAAYVGIAAAVLGVAALVVWSRLSRGARVAALLAVAGGAIGFCVPWHYQQLANSVPRIHDITTDPADPPAYAAVLPARAAERADALAYEPAVAQQQKAAYPDIAPMTTRLAPAEAFARALAAARAMPGWQVVASDPAAGRIEASQSSFWMGFIDDVAIRVRPVEGGSRIDVRSVSRQGRSDLGVNAARVRAYLAELRRTLG
jgi:uncharacterized protein (DUF1499 family)